MKFALIFSTIILLAVVAAVLYLLIRVIRKERAEGRHRR